MRDDNPTGHAEIAALAHQVATARGKLPLQHDNALLEVLSDGEVAAERELAEWIRAQRRGQRRRAMQDELDAEKRDRRADAALRRTEDSDARWHRKALAARRRVASQDARIAQLYRRAEWSSRALIAVVVLGMVWAGVNVQRNLVPSGDMSDPLYWLSYGIEAMISIPIIVIMIAATTAARWGRELPRGRVILVELALLGTTIGLNAGPHLAAGELGRAAEFAIAPIMVGVVIWLHSWVAARYAQLIDDASVDLPIDSMVEAPATRTRAFTERYPAPQAEIDIDIDELVARAHDEFARMGIETARVGRESMATDTGVAPDRTATRVGTAAATPQTDIDPDEPARAPRTMASKTKAPVADSPQTPTTQAPATAAAQETAASADTAVAAQAGPTHTVPIAEATIASTLQATEDDPAPASQAGSISAAGTSTTPATQPITHSSAAPRAHSDLAPTAPPAQSAPSAATQQPVPRHTAGPQEQPAVGNDVEQPAVTAARRPVHRDAAQHPAAPEHRSVPGPNSSHPPAATQDQQTVAPGDTQHPANSPAEPRPDDAERAERPTAAASSATSPGAEQRPPASPRIHLRAVTAPRPPKQEPLPFTAAAAETRPEPSPEPTPAEPKELTSALSTNEPEPTLPDHDLVIESDEAGAWAAAKTIVARGWSTVPVEQLAEILEMADRSRSAASIGAEMGLPRSVVDQAMQAAHKLSRTYAMTS